MFAKIYHEFHHKHGSANRRRACRLLAPPAAFGMACAAALLLASSASHADKPAAGNLPRTDQFLARIMAAHPQSGWTSVIVRLDGELTPEARTQLKALGADTYRDLSLIRSVALRLPSRNLDKLAALPFVQHLSADVAVKKSDEFTTQSSGATTAWASPYNLDGTGIGVAVMDSGINEKHLDLSQYLPNLPGLKVISGDRVTVNVNFVDKSNDPAPKSGQINWAGTWNGANDLTAPSGSANDLCGHGTHVAGIIAGNGNQSSGLLYTHTFNGIAPKASLVNVRVLNAYGQSDVSTVIAGLQWVVTNQKAYSIRVLNLSMGHPVGDYYTNDPLCQAVEAVWKAGIVVVCAAGNDGRVNNTLPTPLAPDNEGYGTAYGSINSPGNDPYVITVGAMKSETAARANDKIATYSGRGPARLDLTLKPDIVAPGNRVISLNVPGSYLDINFSAQTDVLNKEYMLLGTSFASTDYIRLSGTSMATPVVSGAVALMLQANSNLTPDTIKARLMFGADKWVNAQGTGDPCTYGAGYLNIPAALQSTVVATQPALSPSLSQDTNGNVFINMDRALWGTRAIWGTNITDLRAIWGTNAIWGASANLLNASRAIWGTNVWSNRAVWGVYTSQADLSLKVIQGEN